MTEPAPGDGTGKNAVGQAADRRIADRFIFSAVGKMVEPKSKATLTVRVSDINRHGCYADSLNVFPVGTVVRLSVRHSDLQFDTSATIVYSRSGLGMGVMFGGQSEAMGSILDQYISEAKGEDQAPDLVVNASPLDDSKAPEADSRGQQDSFNRLVSLMTHKGLLTPSEAIELLEKLPRNR